ncbi:hypothetical protein SLS53_003323 [Cytospora paraplurivora]|uniref:Uncharacterized protein n=1 Tax=Cytospora paraplurivora TaxID=2898453 RepID=A0AAN9UKM7_9PEZI
MNWPDVHLTYPHGAHPEIYGATSKLLPIREVAMMGIMERLTDKKDWHRKVFDDAIVEKWREEAMAIPDEEFVKTAATPSSEWNRGPIKHLVNGAPRIAESTKIKDVMSKDAFDYCIQELRSKAEYYDKTGIIPTLDASATVVKSDILVKEDLRESLIKAFQKLQDDQASSPDWHPGTNDMVLDLVHPSMYPLIYGQSKVLKDELVGVSDSIEKWAGKGEVIAKDETPVQNPGFGIGWGVPQTVWSNAYQWLPSNIAFQEDGSVKFTSYINNLHPTRYPDIYSTIEKLIETVLPAWDHCLLEHENWKPTGPGRKGSRFAVPGRADDECEENWDPSDPAQMADIELDTSQAWRYDYEEDENVRKWKVLRSPVLREPKPFEEVNYSPYRVSENSESPKPDGEPTPQALVGGLREDTEDTGLQVFVKMVSIELTPDKPEFPAGGWHVEGQLNERICATALYYLDSENITDSSLAFRMHTSYGQDELQRKVGQDSYHWLECLYGTNLGNGGECIQNYGSVDTHEGRLLAFPNVFQHRVSPFKLVDPTKPGHRRFIALWVVDPHCRVISTANVPPQQQDWWTESVFGKSEDSQKSSVEKLPAEVVQLLREKGVALPGNDKGASLPPELVDIVRQEFGCPTISLEEAKEHRLKLMEERSAGNGRNVGGWRSASYNFCEH